VVLTTSFRKLFQVHGSSCCRFRLPVFSLSKSTALRKLGESVGDSHFLSRISSHRVNAPAFIFHISQLVLVLGKSALHCALQQSVFLGGQATCPEGRLPELVGSISKRCYSARTTRELLAADLSHLTPVSDSRSRPTGARPSAKCY